MKEFYLIFSKAFVFFMLGVVLASLFVWCLVQGVMAHLAGNTSTAMVYYFVAWLGGVGGLALYLQAKFLFHYAKISRE